MVDNGSTVFAAVMSLILFGSALPVGAVGPERTATSNQLSDPSPTHSQTQNASYLRLVHASPDAPSVDVYLGDQPVVTNASFSTVSEYQPVTSGSYNVTVTLADDPEAVVLEETIDVPSREAITTYIVGEITENATTEVGVVGYIDDPITPVSNESAVSFVHLSPDASAVDVTIDNGSVVLANNVTYLGASDYQDVSADNYSIEIREETPTNDGEVIETVSGSFESGEAYTVVTLGYRAPDDQPTSMPFEVVVTRDATVTLHLPEDDT